MKEDWLPANEQNLWDFFLDNIIEINNSDKMKNKVVKNFVTEAIVRIFDQAHTNNKLHKADHFIFWVNSKSISINNLKIDCWILFFIYIGATFTKRQGTNDIERISQYDE